MAAKKTKTTPKKRVETIGPAKPRAAMRSDSVSIFSEEGIRRLKVRERQGKAKDKARAKIKTGKK